MTEREMIREIFNRLRRGLQFEEIGNEFEFVAGPNEDKINITFNDKGEVIDIY